MQKTNSHPKAVRLKFPPFDSGQDYPRVQILTVKEVVEEKKRFMTPTKLGTKALPDQTRLPV